MMSDKTNIAAIVLARLDSSRLPGKALKKVNSIPLIGYVIKRAKLIEGVDSIILATTDRAVDTPLCEYALEQGILVHKGPLENVAERVLGCIGKVNCNYFIRLNGDSPFLDHDLIGEGIRICRQNNYDLITNIRERTYPYGISVEIVNAETFRKSYVNFHSVAEFEHITKHFYDNISRFRVYSMTNSRKGGNGYRLTVDYEKDFIRFGNIVNMLGNRYDKAGYEEILDIAVKNPGLFS